jgi:ubiquinone/menaquinone biosynthesis C-methylase UbiE
MENARIEGVAELVELKSADVRELPVPDASFDVVVSSLAIHTISDAAGRESAIREMARVLKSGGQLALADIRHTQQYEQILRSLGWEQTQCWSTSFIFGTPARVLRATKP